jgi:hypothetical protein
VVRLISFNVVIARFLPRQFSPVREYALLTSGLHIKSLHELVKNSLSARCPGTGRILGVFVSARRASSFNLDLNSSAWALRVGRRLIDIERHAT